MTDDNNLNSNVQGADTVSMLFPTSLVEQLQDLFLNEKIDFNKVLFTVFWINKGKWNNLKKKYEPYQEVSSRFPNWLSIPGKKGTDFIKRLVDGGIIRQQAGYVTAKHYTRYTLAEPFDYKGKDARGDDYQLYTLKEDAGAFVRKYIADNFVVKIASTYKSKAVKASNVEAVNNSEFQNLHDMVKKMQMQIEQMQVEINGLKQLQNIKKEEISTATIEEYIQDDSDVVEEEIEIVKKSEPNVIEDNGVNMLTFQTNDIYAIEIIDLINNGIMEFDDIFVAVYSKYFQALDDEDIKMEVIDMLSSKIDEFIGS